MIIKITNKTPATIKYLLLVRSGASVKNDSGKGSTSSVAMEGDISGSLPWSALLPKVKDGRPALFLAIMPVKPNFSCITL